MKKIRRHWLLVLALSFAVIAIGQVAYALLSLLSNGAASSYIVMEVLLIYIAAGFFGGLVVGFALNYIDSIVGEEPYYYGFAVIIALFLAVWATLRFQVGVVFLFFRNDVINHFHKSNYKTKASTITDLV